jgi:putative tricarboxylic transport membrane protein
MRESEPPHPNPWLRGDRVAGLLLALIGTAGAAEAIRQLPFGTLSQPGPAYAPFLVSVLLIVLGLATAAGGRSSPRRSAIGWSELPHAVRVIGGIAFAALAIERLGYRLTALALLLFYLGIAGRRPVAATLAVAFGLAFGTHYLFARLLKVPLPAGPLGL